LLDVEPGLYYSSPFNGTLRFAIKDGPVIEIPLDELAQPLRGLDPTGKMTLQNNVTVVNVFNQEAPEGTAVLGKVFLSQACSAFPTIFSKERLANPVLQVYLTVNYDLQQFQLAPAVTGTGAALALVPFQSSNSITCPSSPRDSSYIGVIVLGCALAMILLLATILYLRHRNNRNRTNTSTSEIDTNTDMEKTSNHVAALTATPVEAILAEAVPRETNPTRTVAFRGPFEVHEGPRGSSASELDPEGKVPATRVTSRTLSSGETSAGEISPIHHHRYVSWSCTDLLSPGAGCLSKPAVIL
jgi:hypothetical protein